MGFQDPLDRIPTSRIQCSCLGGVTRIRLVVLDMSTFFYLKWISFFKHLGKNLFI
ncbi:hypothetical protein HanXRQr2_Chr13g0587131 [Helianthus annuus]|uniref:Uncharacterized protein n=1 Tax=Helianthus annuus TaxID=4232 RepID=A0A9K3EGW9_HELAN|nr:hypothetical protein HanXRQr2_Chr13g0587131 [Helianthus annuus]KAJ0849128.1 hypothetical protein HanPSC8_Chr13g0565341 [Helianthus annuus]